MDFHDLKLCKLTPEESVMISGGDKFMYDLGSAIGRIGGWFSNLSYPSAMYANTMSRRAV